MSKLLLLALPLLLSFLFPLWRISMKAPQYPDGLYMDIWSYQLTGGNDGHDIVEINTLNHYIGMPPIDPNAPPPKRPAVLCLQQTTGVGKDEPAGIRGDPTLKYALELAERGFVTLAPD